MQAKSIKETTMSSNNLLPEQQFKRAFQPLTSRIDGKAQLTYMGYQHGISKNDTGFLKIIFSVPDVIRENPAVNISVATSYKISENNLLGRLLKLMGFTHEVKEVVHDPDDEFGYSLTHESLTEKIYEFLDTQKGLMFKGFCRVPEKDTFYRIEVDSLVPLLDKTSNHKRAFDATEGIDNDYLSIDLEAQES